jgi:transposase
MQTETGLDWQSDGPKETTFEKVLKKLNQGHSKSSIAKITGLSKSSVYRYEQRANQEGLLIPTSETTSHIPKP